MKRQRTVQVTKVQEVTVTVYLCDFCREEYAEDELMALTLPAPKVEDHSSSIQHYVLSDDVHPRDVELCETCALQVYGTIAERVAHVDMDDSFRSSHWVKENTPPTIEEVNTWITREEAGVPVETIIDWERDGLLRHVWIRRHHFYDPHTLNKCIEAQQETDKGE